MNRRSMLRFATLSCASICLLIVLIPLSHAGEKTFHLKYSQFLPATHEICSYIHVHPDVEVSADGTSCVGPNVLLCVVPMQGAGMELAETSYCPEFNRRLSNTEIRLRPPAGGHLLAYALTLQDGRVVSLRAEEQGVPDDRKSIVYVKVDEREYTLSVAATAAKLSRKV